MSVKEIPIDSRLPADSEEIVRIFRRPDGKLFFMVQRMPFEDADPATWGLILVDLAHHVANSMEKNGPVPIADILARIREIETAEWADRTDTVERVLDA